MLQILRKYWYLLQDIPKCEQFPEVGYRKTQSLKDILTSSDFSSDDWTTPTSSLRGHHKCGQCSVCHLNMETRYVDFTDLGFRHELHQFSNCKTKICIELLSCKCMSRYVGSTQRQLKIRLQEHWSRRKH